MTISEKAAYLKGLMDGLNLDTEKAEGKMIAAVVELLGDVTKRLTDVEETTIAISDELDEIEDDLLPSRTSSWMRTRITTMMPSRTMMRIAIVTSVIAIATRSSTR